MMIRTLSAGPIRYLCFPPAGAGASFFRPFATHGAGVAAIDLPGRETRHREPFATDRAALVDELADVLPNLLDADEVVYLGHSLGATIAFELALRLPPRLLVLSARDAAPVGSWQPAPDARAASDEELTEWLRALGGTPDEALAHEGLRALILSVVRADLALGAQPGAPGDADCDLLTVCGDRDPAASAAGMAGWRDRVRRHRDHLALSGDHDALRRHAAHVMKAIDNL